MEDIMVGRSRHRQIGQQHGNHDAEQQDYALRPWLISKFTSSLLEVSEPFGPSINRDQSHHSENFNCYVPDAKLAIIDCIMKK